MGMSRVAVTHACPPMECHSGGQVWRRLCPAKPFLTASFTGEAKMAPTDPGWVDGNISLQKGAAYSDRMLRREVRKEIPLDPNTEQAVGVRGTGSSEPQSRGSFPPAGCAGPASSCLGEPVTPMSRGHPLTAPIMSHRGLSLCAHLPPVSLLLPTQVLGLFNQ